MKERTVTTDDVTNVLVVGHCRYKMRVAEMIY